MVTQIKFLNGNPGVEPVGVVGLGLIDSWLWPWVDQAREGGVFEPSHSLVSLVWSGILGRIPL